MEETSPQTIMLLTRPERQSRRFLGQCSDVFGFRPQTLIAPMMQVVPRRQFILPPDDETILVTSENALDVLFDRSDLTGRRAICVGRNTTRSAQAYGLAAEYGGPNVAELFRFLVDSGEKGPFGHVRGEFTTGTLAGDLSSAGIPANEYIVYEQRAVPLTEGARTVLSLDRMVVVPLFSRPTLSVGLTVSTAGDTIGSCELARFVV